MAIMFYIVSEKVSLSANATGDIEIRTDANEEITLFRFAFESTGAFSIVDWEDSRGMSFTSATTDDPILSTVLPIKQANLDVFGKFDEPLVIPPATVHTIKVTDTSGAPNTVRFYGFGKREIK